MNVSLTRLDLRVPAPFRCRRRRQQEPARLSRKGRRGLAMARPRGTAFFSGAEQSNWNFSGMIAPMSFAPAGLVLMGLTERPIEGWPERSCTHRIKMNSPTHRRCSTERDQAKRAQALLRAAPGSLAGIFPVVNALPGRICEF